MHFTLNGTRIKRMLCNADYGGFFTTKGTKDFLGDDTITLRFGWTRINADFLPQKAQKIL
jgi:hypothetical protein